MSSSGSGCIRGIRSQLLDNYFKLYYAWARKEGAEMIDINAHYKALLTIPKSKYAIPMSELMPEFLEQSAKGDLVFLEVREYKKHTYIRRLYGSYGGFNREKVSLPDASTFVRLIASEPLKYAKLFGLAYKCCAKCMADLTDERSRELALGPICRKSFGLK